LSSQKRRRQEHWAQSLWHCLSLFALLLTLSIATPHFGPKSVTAEDIKDWFLVSTRNWHPGSAITSDGLPRALRETED